MSNFNAILCKRLTAFVLAVLALCMPAFAQLQPSPQVSGAVDIIQITVTRFGPYPGSITHSATPFLLCIVNRSGVLEDTFSVVQGATQGGQSAPLPSLLDLHSTLSKQRDHALIQPLAGSYHLIFQSHPGWMVNFTITGN